MLVNRVGDIGLVLAMLLILREFGTLEFTIINNLLIVESPEGPMASLPHQRTPTNAGVGSNIICLLLFLGAVGKSAQLGLHT